MQEYGFTLEDKDFLYFRGRYPEAVKLLKVRGPDFLGFYSFDGRPLLEANKRDGSFSGAIHFLYSDPG